MLGHDASDGEVTRDGEARVVERLLHSPRAASLIVAMAVTRDVRPTAAHTCLPGGGIIGAADGYAGDAAPVDSVGKTGERSVALDRNPPRRVPVSG